MHNLLKKNENNIQNKWKGKFNGKDNTGRLLYIVLRDTNDIKGIRLSRITVFLPSRPVNGRERGLVYTRRTQAMWHDLYDWVWATDQIFLGLKQRSTNYDLVRYN